MAGEHNELREAYQRTTPARWIGEMNLWAEDTEGRTLWEYIPVARQMADYETSDLALADVAFMALAHERMPGLLDKLDKLQELEQQLAQAWQTAEEHGKMLDQVRRDRIGSGLWKEQARALLETWLAWASTPSRQSDQHLLQAYEKTRAFLARQKEASEN